MVKSGVVNIRYTAVEADNVGSKLYIDSDNNLYIQPLDRRLSRLY